MFFDVKWARLSLMRGLCVCFVFLRVRLLPGGAAPVGTPLLWPWAASHIHPPAHWCLYHVGLSVVSVSPSHTHTDTHTGSPLICLQRWMLTLYRVPPSSSLPQLHHTLPTPSLQMLKTLLPWRPCQLHHPLSLFHRQDTPWARCDYIVTLLKYFCERVCSVIFLFFSFFLNSHTALVRVCLSYPPDAVCMVASTSAERRLVIKLPAHTDSINRSTVALHSISFIIPLSL